MSESRDDVARLSGELAGKAAQVDQLTSLSLRGDATLQDYMASLKVGAGLQYSGCLIGLACQVCVLPDSKHLPLEACCLLAYGCLSSLCLFKSSQAGTLNKKRLYVFCCLCLQSLSAELRARKLEVDDLKAQIEAKDDALAAAGAETNQMHKVKFDSMENSKRKKHILLLCSAGLTLTRVCTWTS